MGTHSKLSTALMPLKCFASNLRSESANCNPWGSHGDPQRSPGHPRCCPMNPRGCLGIPGHARIPRGIPRGPLGIHGHSQGITVDAEGISGGRATCASTAAVASTDAVGAGVAGPFTMTAGGEGISGWPRVGILATSVAGLSLASCGGSGAASTLSGADDGRSERSMSHTDWRWAG